MSTNEERDRGLVVLSFDGGGVRGLSSLLILQECMKRLHQQLGLNRRPEVYEYFDMVGGTGTGGISAVLLGRLRIPLDLTIKQFAKLATDVFSDKKYHGSSAFKSTKMQQAIKNIIRDATGNENEGMMEQRPETQRCKTVIFAMSKHNLNAGLPRAFRSYQLSVNQVPDCTIWEALCATTAHPDLFKSIDIGNGAIKESFIDGGLGCSNPLPHVLNEVKLAYPDRHVGCILSIGAGHARTIHIPKFSPFQRLLPSNVIEAMKGLAMDSEKEAQQMAVRFQGTQDVYFRLNVDQGMQSVELGDWEHLGEVTAHARGYMRRTEISTILDKSASAIVSRRQAIAVAHVDGQVPAAIGHEKHRGVMICPPPTSLFVGREQPVHQAAAYLLDDRTQRKIFIIHGLGGAGKTQMALRIVEKTLEHWSDIVFVDATSVTTIETILKDFATRKGVGDTHEDSLRWLKSTPARWLLVVDSADDLSVNIIRYLPEGSGGRIIITTRNRELLDLTSEPDSDYNVSSMESDEALQLLLKASRRENEDLGQGEMHAAEQLLEDFGCLPLAITQAGGYIRKNQCSFVQYRELYLKQPEKMMQKHSGIRMQLNRYERTTFDTWLLSYELLSEGAKHLLWILGYMQRDRITVEIFRRAALNIKKIEPGMPLSGSERGVYNHVKELMVSFLDSQDDWDCDTFLSMMGEILSLSLIEYDRLNNTYVLHPLVQAWVQTMAPQKLGNMHTAYLLASSLDWNEAPDDHSFLQFLHPHVNSALQQCRILCTTVTTCLANVFYENGQWERASVLQREAVELRLLVLGDDHPDTLAAMHNLANTYSKQGREKEAEELQVHVLEASNRVLGERHPDTLKSTNSLAITYYNQGRRKEAEVLQLRVLDAMKQVRGEEHLDTLAAMNNLAIIFDDQGQKKEAEELRVKVLNTTKQMLGVDHPKTLTAMSNLVITYSRQGRWEEAEGLQLQVLDTRRRVLGEGHYDALTAMSNLATVYCGQSRLNEVEDLRVQVLNRMEQLLGKMHPDTLTAMSNLANTYYHQGRWKEAEELQVRVLDVRNQILGEAHPDTLAAMSHLVTIYSDQACLKDAEQLQVRILDIRKQVLGKEHPDTLSAMHNLATTYLDQERLEEAKELQVYLLDASKRVLGEGHFNTLTVKNNLAITLCNEGQHKEAEQLWGQVLSGMKQVLGVDHPDTLSVMNNLALVYSNQGCLKDAEELQIQVLDARKRALRNGHPDTLTTISNLALTYSDQGRWKEAEELQVQVLNSRKQVLGPEHPDTLNAMYNLSRTFYDQARLKEAEELQLQVQRTRERTLGTQHPSTLRAIQGLSRTYKALGQSHCGIHKL